MKQPHRARRRSGARAALAWGVAVFALLQVGLALAIQGSRGELRDPYYADKARHLRRRLAGESPRPLTVIMLGSSRTVFGLQGARLEAELSREFGRPAVVFNFGSLGAGPVSQLLYLRRLLAEGVRPDLVLVEVLPTLLAGGEGEPPREARWLNPNRLWLEEIEALRRYHFPADRLRDSWLAEWTVPWFFQRFALLSRVAPAWLPHTLREDWFRDADPSGYVAGPAVALTPERYRKGVAYARHEHGPVLESLRLGGPATRALEDLLRLCRQERLPAALVLMPEGSEFRSLYSAPVWSQVATYLGELSRREGVPLVNAREWVPDHGFSDAHHLLPAGGATFTDRLGREALRPLLRDLAARKSEAGTATAWLEE